ncbi:MAG: tetratricopeptide repeat protein, partial [Myxococcota bacterium]
EALHLALEDEEGLFGVQLEVLSDSKGIRFVPKGYRWLGTDVQNPLARLEAAQQVQLREGPGLPLCFEPVTQDFVLDAPAQLALTELMVMHGWRRPQLSAASFAYSCSDGVVRLTISELPEDRPENSREGSPHGRNAALSIGERQGQGTLIKTYQRLRAALLTGDRPSAISEVHILLETEPLAELVISAVRQVNEGVAPAPAVRASLLQRAVARKPKDAELILDWSRSLVSSSPAHEAVEPVLRLLKWTTLPVQTQAEILINIGKTLLNASNYDLAARVIEEALQLSPDQPECWVALGELEARRSNHERAADHFHRAHGIYASRDAAPLAAECLIHAAECLRAGGALIEALEFAHRATVIHPTLWAVQTLTGLCRLSSNVAFEMKALGLLLKLPKTPDVSKECCIGAASAIESGDLQLARMLVEHAVATAVNRVQLCELRSKISSLEMNTSESGS